MDPTPPTPPAPAPSDTPAQISFDDFARVDLRVARVLSAREHPNADKLLVLTIDVGDPEPRQICAGIRGRYQPEQLVGSLIVVVYNLAPRKLRGELSHGMLLAASPPDKSEIILLTTTAAIAPGSRIS